MNKDVEKIRAEVKRRREIHRKAKRIESAFEDNAILSYIDSIQKEPEFKVGDKVRYKYNNICTKPRIIAKICGLSHYVDTDNHRMDMAYTDANFELVEEPKKCMYSKDNYTDEDRKVLCGGCEEECQYSKSDDFTKALAECIHQAQGNVFDPMVFAELWKDELIKLAKREEPVSEDLGDYINELSKQFPEVSFAKLSRIAVRVAKWQKEHLLKPANGDDLPEIDREVIALLDNGKVVFAHRPYKGKYIGKNLTTGNIETFENETYDKCGWNVPNVKWWLDCSMPKEIEL